MFNKVKGKNFDLLEIKHSEIGKEVLKFISFGKLKSDQLAHFADTLYKRADNDMKKARSEHFKIQKNCNNQLDKLSKNKIIFENLMTNITDALKLINTKFESNNNNKGIIEARLAEIDKHYNRNEILMKLWIEFTNKTTIILKKSSSQIKELKNELSELKSHSHKKQSLIEIDPSSHKYKKLRNVMLDISQHEGIHHHGFNTAIKSIVHVIKKHMKLNKNQIKLIKNIIGQYRKWAKEFVENLNERTKRLNIFYEKYKTNLKFHKILINKEKVVLDQKGYLYEKEKREYESIYKLQSNQINLLKEVYDKKKELCDKEKVTFKHRIGVM